MFIGKLNRKLLATAISGAAISIAPISTAHAQCSDFSNDINALHQLITLACEGNEELGDDDNWIASGCDLWTELDEAGIPTSSVDVWNLLADNGSLTIGSRALVEGVRADGNLIQGTKKTFILQDLIDDDFEIDINYESGQADLEVSVCHIDDDGSKEIVANYFDENRSGLNPTVSVDESGMYAVLLKARSTGMGVQRYKYNITVEVDNQEAAEDDKPKYRKIDPSKIGEKAKQTTMFPKQN